MRGLWREMTLVGLARETCMDRGKRGSRIGDVQSAMSGGDVGPGRMTSVSTEASQSVLNSEFDFHSGCSSSPRNGRLMSNECVGYRCYWSGLEHGVGAKKTVGWVLVDKSGVLPRVCCWFQFALILVAPSSYTKQHHNSAVRAHMLLGIPTSSAHPLEIYRTLNPGHSFGRTC